MKLNFIPQEVFIRGEHSIRECNNTQAVKTLAGCADLYLLITLETNPHMLADFSADIYFVKGRFPF